MIHVTIGGMHGATRIICIQSRCCYSPAYQRDTAYMYSFKNILKGLSVWTRNCAAGNNAYTFALAIATAKHLDAGDVYNTFLLPVQLALVAVVAEYSCNSISGVDGVDASAPHREDLAVNSRYTSSSFGKSDEVHVLKDVTFWYIGRLGKV